MTRLSNILNLYKETLRIRLIETEISKKYIDQKMRCPVHLSIGQESIAVAVCSNLKKKDIVISAHRSHAHYLAKGGNLKKMIAELHGKETGCAKGRGGSMHLVDYKNKINAAVPIVGSSIPIGVGMAWANKLKKNNDIVVIFFGDAATEEGSFLESIDFASLHDLKILFVCENNKYSVYSNIRKRQSNSRSITKIANSVGMKSTKNKNFNILKISISAKKALSEILTKSKPHLMEIDTFRFIEHCGPNNDDHLKYRNKDEILYWHKKDQIKYLESYLFKKKYLNQSLKKKIIENIKFEIDKAFIFAENSNFPKKSELLNYIYEK